MGKFPGRATDLRCPHRSRSGPFGDLHEIATILVKNQWPLRLHATYGETIRHVMEVFEQVKREQGRFAPRWAIDHAATVADHAPRAH